jgi:hypothetical protein
MISDHKAQGHSYPLASSVLRTHSIFPAARHTKTDDIWSGLTPITLVLNFVDRLTAKDKMLVATFTACVVFCAVFSSSVMCVICVLCLIAVSLPPGKNPFAV